MGTPSAVLERADRHLPAGASLQPGEHVVTVMLPWWFATFPLYLFTLGFWEIWRRRHYLAITNQRLIYGKGIVLSKTRRSVPLARVQDATYERRLFIGGVAISSAGGSFGKVLDMKYRPKVAKEFVRTLNESIRYDRSAGMGDGNGAPRSKSDDPADALRRLAKLREENLLDDSEYEAKRQELLKRL